MTKISGTVSRALLGVGGFVYAIQDDGYRKNSPVWGVTLSGCSLTLAPGFGQNLVRVFA